MKGPYETRRSTKGMQRAQGSGLRLNKILYKMALKEPVGVPPGPARVYGPKKTRSSRLSEEQVRAIRRDSEEGLSYNEIAAKHNVSFYTVNGILLSRTYEWVI